MKKMKIHGKVYKLFSESLIGCTCKTNTRGLCYQQNFTCFKTVFFFHSICTIQPPFSTSLYVKILSVLIPVCNILPSLPLSHLLLFKNIFFSVPSFLSEPRPPCLLQIWKIHLQEDIYICIHFFSADHCQKIKKSILQRRSISGEFL